MESTVIEGAIPVTRFRSAWKLSVARRTPGKSLELTVSVAGTPSTASGNRPAAGAFTTYVRGADCANVIAGKAHTANIAAVRKAWRRRYLIVTVMEGVVKVLRSLYYMRDPAANHFD